MNTSSEILTQRNIETPPATLGISPVKKINGPVLVPWDRQKTYSFICLTICFVIWACVFFPLIK
ncbi:unnamed protein product [Acanthoscelides obtectus]|uniref:Uncharacterized protein n=1 Tax=Acanthoscelides obtectus TaxID=200917 RepID=A0A9P0K2D8_ACAOB|nr:unnamed protein product [Acanthoscelides obtectus]CAK1632594.1 hypothetical protein AOBTE_LOCUS7637 [Acanthoscelides obtectus]